ncbi:hypothetical protein BHM03_00037989 [Ensete ventricosum]|nr:hypothetical protein BHM03_00037989 [Ensete ventricosum]
MVTRPSRRPASDNWPADVADPMREASRAQVWGRQRSYGRPDAGKADTLTCRRMPYRKDSGHGGSVRQHDKPQGQPGCQTRRRNTSTRQAPDLTLTFLALEGGSISPERPFGDSGTEHHPEPDHPRPTEEATVAVPTPNRFWRMMTNSGFPSPASNPAPFMVTIEAFLDLTGQVQALAGMVQTIIPYLSQLVHSMAHQSAPPAAPPRTESPAAPNRGTPPDVEPPQPHVTEARAASSTPTPARSQSRS